MKKIILTITILLLMGCNYNNDSNNILYNAFIIQNDGATDILGINKEDIAGFENYIDENPTMITVNFYGDVNNALEAGCFVALPNGHVGIAGFNEPVYSVDTSSVEKATFNSLLAVLSCQEAKTESYSTDVNISFTADGVYYSYNP